MHSEWRRHVERRFGLPFYPRTPVFFFGLFCGLARHSTHIDAMSLSQKRSFDKNLNDGGWKPPLRDPSTWKVAGTLRAPWPRCLLTSRTRLPASREIGTRNDIPAQRQLRPPTIKSLN